MTSGRRGSPPRMRGKAAVAVEARPTSRITPAYAGKSRRYSKCSGDHADHPRVCGEKCPHTRYAAAHRRITPAYAGKSHRCCSRHFWWWDHPRVCGEKVIGRIRAVSRLGSPPRMRGKEDNTKPVTSGAGITPAYAGKRTAALAGTLSE